MPDSLVFASQVNRMFINQFSVWNLQHPKSLSELGSQVTCCGVLYNYSWIYEIVSNSTLIPCMYPSFKYSHIYLSVFNAILSVTPFVSAAMDTSVEHPLGERNVGSWPLGCAIPKALKILIDSWLGAQHYWNMTRRPESHQVPSDAFSNKFALLITGIKYASMVLYFGVYRLLCPRLTHVIWFKHQSVVGCCSFIGVDWLVGVGWLVCQLLLVHRTLDH